MIKDVILEGMMMVQWDGRGIAITSSATVSNRGPDWSEWIEWIEQQNCSSDEVVSNNKMKEESRERNETRTGGGVASTLTLHCGRQGKGREGSNLGAPSLERSLKFSAKLLHESNFFGP